MSMQKLLAALLVVPALLAPLPGKAEVLYALNFLPENFFPTDINNAGQIAGSIYLNDVGSHAAVYANGAITDLGSFSGTVSEAVAINEAGTVVGNFGLARGPWHAFIYGNGTTQEVGSMYALDINLQGDIVGQTDTGAGALYRQGTLTTLGYLGTGDVSTATAINDAGHVVGTSTIDLDFHSRQHPFLYNDGALHDLGTLDEREFNSAVAINNAGQIAGYSEGPGGGMHAFFYENGVMTDLGSFGGLNLDVGGMNAHGDIVGTGDPWEGPPIAFVTRNGALVDLNTLIDPASGWAMDRAIGINDHGQIIGIACRDFTCSPVRLDLASAVPEPSGVLLSLCGLFMLAGLRFHVLAGHRRARPTTLHTNQGTIMPNLKYRAALALLAVLLVPAPVYAEATYTVTRLPDGFLPTQINNAGQMAGAISFNTGLHTGVYDDGVVTDLGTFGGTYSFAVAMNEAGDLAGNYGPGGNGHGFLYRNGVLQDLGVGSAWGINSAADVVGRVSGATTLTAFLYSQGTLTTLGHLGGGDFSTAYAINNTGQVVGESNLAVLGTETRPFLYQGGALTELGTLAGRGLNRAAAINNAGQIAGYGEAGDGLRHAFLYESGVLTDLGGFGGRDIVIGGMNAAGQVVGTGFIGNSPDAAFLSRDGALVGLNALIDPATGWRITAAFDINDHGQIVGNACQGGQCSAVRLDLAGAVPEPSGLLLSLLGLPMLASTRLRRYWRQCQGIAGQSC
jgi:probable HAF family extracellular repeat protein